MLAVDEITAAPKEQAFIEALQPLFAPHYRSLPYLSYERAHDEVLVEALRLEELEPNVSSSQRPAKRLELIAASLGHGMEAHEDFSPTARMLSKEERAGVIAMELCMGPVREAGFALGTGSIHNIGTVISRNRPHRQLLALNEVRLRRATLSTVGSTDPVLFLADVVRRFYDDVILSEEKEREVPEWEAHIDQQYSRLSSMVKPGLAVGEERAGPGKGPFYEQAVKNLALLTDGDSVREPEIFLATFGQALTARVAGFDGVRPYITGQAAA